MFYIFIELFSFCDLHKFPSTMLNEVENEDLSTVQYFNTSMQDTYNDTNILQQSVMKLLSIK